MNNVKMTVNGKAVSRDVPDTTLLSEFLREDLRLTGTHVGCDTSQCGACVVHVDGRAGKVIEIIAEQAVLDVSDVTMDSTLESLGIDSLGLVESIFAIEEAFDIQVPFNANDPSESDFDISSVATIIAGIEKLVATQS